MPTHINVNGLGLTYKGTVGISTATIPDVCKTPSPGGPIPIPYPNIATQSTLKSGTTTVKAKDQMIAVKGSQYGSSNGDEAGTAGGVKSGVNMKATDWITYSFDVKFDGKNACRNTDKMFHNNQNAADLAGNIDPGAPAQSAEEVLQELMCKCDSEVEQKPGQSCRDLGDEKHDCTDQKVREHNQAGKKPKLGSEMGWSEQEDIFTGETIVEMIPFARKRMRRSQRSGTRWPDAVSFDADDDPQQCFDFKFKCPSSKYEGPPAWGTGQEGRYRRLTRQWGSDPDQYPPTIISNTDC